MATVVSVEAAPARDARVDHITRRLEWPIVILALLVVPALIVEETATDPALLTAAAFVNWFVWLAFCADYALRLAVARDRWAFVRAAWFDAAIIVVTPPFLVPDTLQSLRGARALRLLRLIRAFAIAAVGLRRLRGALQHRRFHWVAVAAVLTVVAGAVAEYYVERGTGTVTSFGDSLWWAVVTATTVGYGDLSPVTLPGRVIAVALMLVGVGVIGTFTASIASWFIEQEQPRAPNGDTDLHRRLDTLEAKVDELLRRGNHAG